MNEILSYEKFVENLRAYLLDTLNLQEERIYFEAKDEEGMAQNGDRLFVECRVSSEGKEVCGIHTEELYEDYLDGISIKRIGDTVTNEILKLKDARLFKKVQDVNNYSKVKGDLFIRLLNKKKHEKALENAVYKEVDGIACVLYMKVGQQGWPYLQHENPQSQSGRLGNGRGRSLRKCFGEYIFPYSPKNL